MVKGFTIALIEVQDKALFPGCWCLSFAENSLCQLSWQVKSLLTSSFQHLSHDTRWDSSLSYISSCCVFGGFGYEHTTKGGTASWMDLSELVVWKLKLDIKRYSAQPTPSSCHRQSVQVYQHHYVHISYQWPWFVWFICLMIWKTPSASGYTVANSYFSA